MPIEQSHRGHVLVISVREERLDQNTAPKFQAAVTGIIEHGEFEILLNLEEVCFIDSTGLGAIMAVSRQLGSRGKVSICGAKDPVLKLLLLTRLDQIFDFYDDEEEALATFVG